MAVFKKEIEEFAGRVQAMLDETYKETGLKPTVAVKFGRKYAKLIKDYIPADLRFRERSLSDHVYGFVDMHTGDIYKAATWKAPAKHARGNIFNNDGGMGACTAYGIKYL